MDGPLTAYSTRGVTPNITTRPALWRSLAGWGFLNVLASHIHRPEYACVPEHVSAAADAFLQVHVLTIIVMNIIIMEAPFCRLLGC
jgi:hypothetical protein